MKAILSQNVTSAFFIEFDKPELWPPGVQENPISPTGYSYGTLETLGDNLDGIPVQDKKWLLISCNGIPRILDDTEFKRIYTVVPVP